MYLLVPCLSPWLILQRLYVAQFAQPKENVPQRQKLRNLTPEFCNDRNQREWINAQKKSFWVGNYISFVYTVLILLALMKKGAAKLRLAEGGGGAQRPVLLITEPKLIGACSKNPSVKNNNTKAQKNWVRVLPIPVQLLLKVTRSSKFFWHSYINCVLYLYRTYCLVSL